MEIHGVILPLSETVYTGFLTHRSRPSEAAPALPALAPSPSLYDARRDEDEVVASIDEAEIRNRNGL